MSKLPPTLKVGNKKYWLGMPLTFEVSAGHLVEARKATKLSQKQFAKRAGVSPQFMCDLEAGRRTINHKTAAKLERVFELWGLT